MTSRNRHAGEPFEDDDDSIAAALEDVSIPALLCSLVHMTGDPSWIRGNVRPRVAISLEFQGRIPDDELADVRRRAVAAIVAYRDGGCRPHTLDRELLHEMMEFLGPVPSVWDETRVLDGKLGDYVVVARRSGATWYLGAMTDWTSRELQIDTSFLGGGEWKVTAYVDPSDHAAVGSEHYRTAATLTSGTPAKFTLASGGGLAAVFTRSSAAKPSSPEPAR